MTPASKAYLVEFGTAMLGYVILLPLAMELVEHHPDAAWRWGVVLLPVIPLCFVLAAMLRFFSRIDELQRRIQLDAVAVAAGVTAIATFAYGMLENVGAPNLNLVLVFPFTVAVWGIAAAVSSRRYR